MTTKIDSNPTEQEIMQQVIYNLVLYLPISKLKLENNETTDPTISQIVQAARKYKESGNVVEEATLEMLEACLKEESGISDIGNARLTYISFKKDANELVEHGISRENAELITNPDAMVAVAFVYEGSEAQGIREGVSFVHRGTPGGAWEDNYDMESDCNGSFVKNNKLFESVSPIGEAVLYDQQDTLRRIREESTEIAGKCRALIGAAKVFLSGHSKGGNHAMLIKCVFEEFRNVTCFAFDAPGPPLELWDEYNKHYRKERVEENRRSIYSIFSFNDPVHAIAYTKERGYFAKNLLRLAAPGLDGEDPSETMNYHYLFQKLRVEADGKVRLQKIVAEEGWSAKKIKELSDILMHMPIMERAAYMHPLMGALQYGYAKKASANQSVESTVMLLLRTAYIKNGPGLLKMLPIVVPMAIEGVFKTEERFRKKLSEQIQRYLEYTKQLVETDRALPRPLGKDAGGLPIIRHDLDFNRSTIALLQVAAGLFGTSVKDIIAEFNDLCTFVTDVVPPTEVRPGMLQAIRTLQAPPSLTLFKNLAYACRAADETIQSCEKRCYPLFRIPEGTHYPRELAELLKRQRTAELKSGVSSIVRDRALLEASILECCGITSLNELETDLPGKRPLVRFAKQVLYDAREIEGVLLNYAARLEKGLREQFVLLGKHESTGQGAAFDTVAFLQSASESAVPSMAAGEVGEAGIDYAAAEHALACAADVSLHCGSLLRDIERLNERLSCLRYVSVSRDGLTELSRLLDSWKSQQEEYREALGNYVMRCRETEEQFCARSAGIAVEK